MRAIVRITYDPQGSWGSDGTPAQDSRAFTWYVLRKLQDALPDYAHMEIIAGVEDDADEAASNLAKGWVATA